MFRRQRIWLSQVHRNAQKKTGEDLWHFVRTCTEELQNVQDLPSLLVCTSNYGSRRVRRNEDQPELPKLAT